MILKRLTRMEMSGIATKIRFPKRCKFPKKIRFPRHWLMDKGPQRSFKLHGNNSTMKSSLPPMKFKLI